jgi:hypothetical protein
VLLNASKGIGLAVNTGNINARRSVLSPGIFSLSHLSLATDVTDVTLGSSGF